MTFDPFSLAGRSDAPVAFARALHRSSVWVEPEVVHALGYDACVEALADCDRFSSDGARYGPAALSRSAPIRTLNSSDPPHHTRLRRSVAAPFTRARVAGLADAIRSTAHQLLDRAPSEGPVDLVGAFANPLVLAVLGQILGIPPAHHDALRHWSDTITSPRDRSDVARARSGLATVITELIGEAERLNPGSLLAELVAERERDDSSVEELVAQCTVLIVAGNETTRNLMGGAIHTLATRPELWETLAAQPSLVPTFVEEALRFHSPVQAAVRYTTGATVLGGVPVPGNTPVFVWVGAANRDPSVVAVPDAFDIGPACVGRAPRQARVAGTPTPSRRHLAFGFGIHACLGAHLARMEAGIAVEVLLERCRRIRLAETETGADAVPMLPSPLARGPVRVLVDLDLAGSARARP